MSALHDRKSYRSLKQAWRQSLKDKNIRSSYRRRWPEVAKNTFWLVFLMAISTRFINAAIVDSGLSNQGEAVSRIIIVSCFGALLGSWWHVRLHSPYNHEFLATTPATRTTILWHSLRSMMPLLTFLLGQTLILAILEYGHSSGRSPVQSLLTHFGSLSCSTAIFLILGNYLRIGWIITLSCTLPVLLCIVNMLFGGLDWITATGTMLIPFWPPSWFIDPSQTDIAPLAIIIIAGILALAGHYAWRQLKQWQFCRSRLEHSLTPDLDWDEFDELEIIREVHQLAGSADLSARQIANSRLTSLLDTENNQPQGKYRWIETLIWKSASPNERDLLRFARLPRYTHKWIFGLVCCALTYLLLHFQPEHETYLRYVRIIHFGLLAFAFIFVTPLGSGVGIYSDRVPISSQSASYLCCLLPISSRQIIRLRWKEGLIRSLFATPVLTFILWLLLHNNNPTQNSTSLILPSALVVLWCLFHYIHLTSTGAFLFSSSSSVKSSDGFIFTCLALLIYISYAAACIGTAVGFCSSAYEPGLLTTICFIYAWLGGLALSVLAQKHYRSPHSDTVGTIQE